MPQAIAQPVAPSAAVDASVTAPASTVAGGSLWGLSPANLHDAFWGSKGVQCIRRGHKHSLQRAADLFLLLEPDQLVLFNISEMTERLMWHSARITRLRLVDQTEQGFLSAEGRGWGPGYSEHVVTDAHGLVQRIERRYRPQVRGSSRVMLTSSRRVASIWMNARSRRDGWDRVRRSVAWSRVDHWKTGGRTFVLGNAAQERQLIDDLVERWPSPNQSIAGLQESAPGVWHVGGETLADGVVRIGPLWLGQGTGAAGQRCLVGPVWLPDDPASARQRRTTSVKQIADVELAEDSKDATVDIDGPPRRVYQALKRGFDIAVSLTALVVLFPILALVAIVVWLDDGLPLFFGHVRQGRGGKPFTCWKFRTMEPDSHKKAGELAQHNLCDGPQVNIRNDPRITRAGRFMRKLNLDELPQFWNVLSGDMSLVGPRPSPDNENQYCPAWRDVRLSVRPGITGLWQLKRTREPGEDFQEWIKYDIEYVQRASFTLDFVILFHTAILVLRGRAKSAAE